VSSYLDRLGLMVTCKTIFIDEIVVQILLSAKFYTAIATPLFPRAKRAGRNYAAEVIRNRLFICSHDQIA
jgi:hypothetical protein